MGGSDNKEDDRIWGFTVTQVENVVVIAHRHLDSSRLPNAQKSPFLKNASQHQAALVLSLTSANQLVSCTCANAHHAHGYVDSEPRASTQ